MLFTCPLELCALPLAIKAYNSPPAIGRSERSGSPPEPASHTLKSWQLLYRLAYHELVRSEAPCGFERALWPSVN
jgi:hypothetical protein